MALNIDRSFIQSRMLNTSKGPAVHSLRVQADKKKYHIEMKKVLENEPNLTLRQGEIIDVLLENDEVKGVLTRTGAVYNCRPLSSSWSLPGGRVFIGEVNYESGPDGMFPLSYYLIFKTGF